MRAGRAVGPNFRHEVVSNHETKTAYELILRFLQGKTTLITELITYFNKGEKDEIAWLSSRHRHRSGVYLHVPETIPIARRLLWA